MWKKNRQWIQAYALIRQDGTVVFFWMALLAFCTQANTVLRFPLVLGMVWGISAFLYRVDQGRSPGKPLLPHPEAWKALLALSGWVLVALAVLRLAYGDGHQGPAASLFYPFAHGLAVYPLFRFLDNLPFLGFLVVVAYPFLLALLVQSMVPQGSFAEALERSVAWLGSGPMLGAALAAIAGYLGWYALVPVVYGLVLQWALVPIALAFDVLSVAFLYVSARALLLPELTGLPDLDN